VEQRDDFACSALDVMGKTITPTVPQRPSKHPPPNQQPLSFTIIGQQKNPKQKIPHPTAIANEPQKATFPSAANHGTYNQSS